MVPLLTTTLSIPGVIAVPRALDTGTTIPPLASFSLGMATKVPPTFTASYRAGATPPISGAPHLPTACKSNKLLRVNLSSNFSCSATHWMATS